jgi:hypothetical protein
MDLFRYAHWRKLNKIPTGEKVGLNLVASDRINRSYLSRGQDVVQFDQLCEIGQNHWSND